MRLLHVAILIGEELAVQLNILCLSIAIVAAFLVRSSQSFLTAASLSFNMHVMTLCEEHNNTSNMCGHPRVRCVVVVIQGKVCGGGHPRVRCVVAQKRPRLADYMKL